MSLCGTIIFYAIIRFKSFISLLYIAFGANLMIIIEKEMNYNAFFAKQEYFICFVHHFILCFLINPPLPEFCCHSMHCSISRNIKTCYFFVKMRLAFFQMRHALGGNAPCFWEYARGILGKARRILERVHSARFSPTAPPTAHR